MLTDRKKPIISLKPCPSHWYCYHQRCRQAAVWALAASRTHSGSVSFSSYHCHSHRFGDLCCCCRCANSPLRARGCGRVHVLRRDLLSAGRCRQHLSRCRSCYHRCRRMKTRNSTRPRLWGRGRCSTPWTTCGRALRCRRRSRPTGRAGPRGRGRRGGGGWALEVVMVAVGPLLERRSWFGFGIPTRRCLVG